MRRALSVIFGILALATISGLGATARADDNDHDYDHRYYGRDYEHRDYGRDYGRYYGRYHGRDYDRDYNAARDEYQRYLDWAGKSWDDNEFDDFRAFRDQRHSGETWSDFRYFRDGNRYD